MSEILFLNITGKEPRVSYYFAFSVVPNYHPSVLTWEGAFPAGAGCFGPCGAARDWIPDFKKNPKNKGFCVASEEKGGSVCLPGEQPVSSGGRRGAWLRPLHVLEPFWVVPTDPGCSFCGVF